MTKSKLPSLTGNDLALAEAGVMHAISWWKGQKPKSDFGRGEIAKYEALLKKLSALHQHAYPYEPGCMPSDCGEDRLMVVNAPVVRETRQSARKANRRGPF